ncbi:MAG: GH36-type glycosyl hydrolase domain-containing protein [Bacillota bacterium]
MLTRFKGDAQIEVGGPYAGIEIHHSSPSLQRISFYYPVANSIDLSTDYWKRDTSYILFMGLKAGKGKRVSVGLEPTEYEVTPYMVSFHKKDTEKSLDITYKFSKNKPAMFIIYELTNNLKRSEVFEFDTHLETSVKTSHTFKLIDSAWTEFDQSGYAIYTNFESPETQNVQLFVANAGEIPAAYNSRSKSEVFQTGKGEIITKDNQSRPAAKYLYRKRLAPKEKMTIVQIVGSCRQDEGRENVKYLTTNYKSEIRDFENSVNDYVYKQGYFRTGDNVLDKSYFWAKAILDVNRHYIDGVIAPMPCPAEYNFYFSHDVFLTDLSAVNFDLPRVKRDLEFTLKHSGRDSIIPHAYYWKDSAFVTEFATPDNWNHFWFIIMSASYLRHSGDKELAGRLYPYLKKSIQEALRNNKDGIIWAYRPDWWDIGRNFGPRAFMTILASKALKDFVYISSETGKGDGLNDYEVLSYKMQQQLNSKLWDDSLKYLINYFEDGSKDKHYYIGSLPAADFRLISGERIKEMVQTAEKYLLDKKLGIYTVYPMDFHKLISYLKFAGNEAGDPFYYINGGIWSHGNTFYALALKAAGRRSEAIEFVKKVMTIDGVMNSPNGEPAMYEYRNGNFNDSEVYGKVDKPQFMWAAGFYIYNLYHLLGIDENAWNISFTPYLLNSQESLSFSLSANGKALSVEVKGKGNYIRSIKYDGNAYPSAVLLESLSAVNKISISLGKPEAPYISRAEAKVISADYNQGERRLSARLSAFSGHNSSAEVISPFKPVSVFINGEKLKEGSWRTENSDNVYKTTIGYSHKTSGEELRIDFK